MPLTKDFKETVRARLLRSSGFRKAVLQEAIDALLAGDVDTGKALLRDYINGTMGFERLGELTDIPTKSLMRMLGPKGNPQARNLFGVIGHLQLRTSSRRPWRRTGSWPIEDLPVQERSVRHRRLSTR